VRDTASARPQLSDRSVRPDDGGDGARRSATRRSRRLERRGRLTESALVAGGSILSAVAFTWPLVLHLQTRVHNRFDAVFQAWTIDWVQYAVDHGRNLYNANIFVPEHTTLAYSDTLIGVAIPTLPLRWLGVSPIGVLNIVLLLGFATSAAAGYVFVRLVTRSRVAAAVGGAAYAYGPFGVVAAGHLHVAVRPGVPLAAAAAWWLADRARDRGRLLLPAVSLAAVIAWQGTVSFSPATYAAIAAAVVLAVRVRSLRWAGIGASAAALGVAGACGALLAIPNLEVAARHPSSYRFTLQHFAVWGGSFDRVEPGLVVWGSILGHTKNDIPTAVFPGATLIVLALLGAVTAWRARGASRRAATAGLALVLAGSIIAVGTARTGWRQYAPYRLLYDLGPPFSVLRGTARGWMIGLCGMGLLAGLGVPRLVAWLQARLVRWRSVVPPLVGALLVVLILVEGYDPWFNRPNLHVAPVDVELARRHDGGGVVYLPMNTSSGFNLSIFTQPANLLGETLHHRPTPSGYSGYTPPSYYGHSRALMSLPSASARALLRRLGVRYVVVHSSVAGSAWERLRSPSTARPLRFLGRFGDDDLYELPTR
jgi:hypothetical protein